MVETESVIRHSLAEGEYEFLNHLMQIRIVTLDNDYHCESWSRFENGELCDLIENQLDFVECTHACNRGNSLNFLHRKESLMCALHKTSLSNYRMQFADTIWGGLIGRTLGVISY